MLVVHARDDVQEPGEVVFPSKNQRVGLCDRAECLRHAFVVGARQIKEFLRVLLRAADSVKLYA